MYCWLVLICVVIYAWATHTWLFNELEYIRGVLFQLGSKLLYVSANILNVFLLCCFRNDGNPRLKIYFFIFKDFLTCILFGASLTASLYFDYLKNKPLITNFSQFICKRSQLYKCMATITNSEMLTYHPNTPM